MNLTSDLTTGIATYERHLYHFRLRITVNPRMQRLMYRIKPDYRYVAENELSIGRALKETTVPRSEIFLRTKLEPVPQPLRHSSIILKIIIESRKF